MNGIAPVLGALLTALFVAYMAGMLWIIGMARDVIDDAPENQMRSLRADASLHWRRSVHARIRRTSAS
jgi:hypothetical protein